MAAGVVLRESLDRVESLPTRHRESPSSHLPRGASGGIALPDDAADDGACPVAVGGAGSWRAVRGAIDRVEERRKIDAAGLHQPDGIGHRIPTAAEGREIPNQVVHPITQTPRVADRHCDAFHLPQDGQIAAGVPVQAKRRPEGSTATVGGGDHHTGPDGIGPENLEPSLFRRLDDDVMPVVEVAAEGATIERNASGVHEGGNVFERVRNVSAGHTAGAHRVPVVRAEQAIPWGREAIGPGEGEPLDTEREGLAERLVQGLRVGAARGGGVGVVGEHWGKLRERVGKGWEHG